ncbi:MAG TPA: HAMP domain-containing protein [Gammaproteobacteria bacterium]|nr:HAMP domain-containing protein [Gammaproteobacteria bacterium]
MNSLRLRLLVSAGAALLLFTVLTGLALDQALKNYTQQAEHDRLQGLVFSLLGAIEIDAAGIGSYSLERVPEPRLAQPDSGLYVVIYDDFGNAVWQSSSLLEEAAPMPPVEVNEWRFSVLGNNGSALSYGFEWVVGHGQVRRYTLYVADIDSPLKAQRKRLARGMWLWLLGISGVLLLIFLSLLHWGLRPLRRIRGQLDAVRNGKLTRLSEDAPDEIRPLTQSVNALLAHEQHQRERFLHATADLAHSLKTPLAVLRNQLANAPEASEQLDAMERIISYQLQRATTTRIKPLTHPIAVQPVFERIIRALKKVYADKRIRFNNAIPPDYQLRIAGDDLMELAGNLLENAAKYGRSRVDIAVEKRCLTIEDDGPGFPDNATRLLRRGMRADTREKGQGIGLAVANEIIDMYSGKLSIEKSAGGGARLVLCFEDD